MGVFSDNTTALSYIHRQGHVLTCLESQGPTPPALGGVFGHYLGAPVHHRGTECRCRFTELSGPDHRLRVDLGSGESGGGRRVGEEVASDGRPLCHLPQLSSPRVFIPLERSYGSGDRCLSPVLGRAPSLCVPSIRSDLTRSEVPVQQGHSSHISGSSLATGGVVSGVPVWRWLLWLPCHCSDSHMYTIYTRTITSCSFMHGDCAAICATLKGLSRGIARQLLMCRRSSSRRLHQYCWECYRCWCSDCGHSVSNPSVAKIADFLMFLRAKKHLSVPTIHRYHSTLSLVF